MLKRYPSQEGYYSLPLLVLFYPLFLIMRAQQPQDLIALNASESLIEIDTTDAKEMVKHFLDTSPKEEASPHGALLINPPSIYFDLKPLAWYILKALPKGASGLRVYFGRYTKPSQHPNNNGIDYTNCATVIFVPTKKIE